MKINKSIKKGTNLVYIFTLWMYVYLNLNSMYDTKLQHIAMLHVGTYMQNSNILNFFSTSQSQSLGEL